MDSVRVDQWLWAVRLFKTRTAATEACRGGHVRVNGSSTKPATRVRLADRVHVRVHDRDRDLEVVALIDKRVGAPLAAECFADHSVPVEAVRRDLTLARDRGSGRPTKRERRQLDRFRR